MAGFIHNKLDIKLLVLYLLDRLAGPVEFAALTDLALCDDGVDYFRLSEAVRELAESGHVNQEGDRYAITDRGRRNIAESEGSLSPVIRKRCDQSVGPVNQRLRRENQFRADLEPLENGCRLNLRFSDGTDDLLILALWTPSEKIARGAAERFKADPRRLYDAVLSALTGDGIWRDGA